MEIVKQGDKIYKCKKCGCECRINKISDVHYGFVGFDDTGFFIKKPLDGEYLICPQCGNKIVISINW